MAASKVDKVRVGIVGIGWVSFSHIKGYLADENAEIVALCDLSEKHVKRVADQFGVRKTYTDYDEMLKDPEINTISITTPTHTHADLIIKAAKASKNILCEKPFCLTLEEGEAACKAAEDAGVTLGVEETYPFVSSIHKARELIDAGEIGKPQQIRERFGAWNFKHKDALDAIQSDNDVAQTQDWREDSRKAGGNGYPWLFDHNVHFFAAAEALMNGGHITEIYSVTADNSFLKGKNEDPENNDVVYDVLTGEDVPIMVFKFEDPACRGTWTRAEVLNGKYDPYMGFSLTVHGETGMIEVLGEGGAGLYQDGKPVHLVLHKPGQKPQTFRFDEGGDDFWDSEISYYSQGHSNRVHEFVSALVEGRPTAYTGRDGLRQIHETIASICSAREGVPVRVMDTDDARLYKPVAPEISVEDVVKAGVAPAV